MATPLTYRSGIPVVFVCVGLLFVGGAIWIQDSQRLFMGIMGGFAFVAGCLCSYIDQPLTFDEQGIYLPGRTIFGEPLCIPWREIRELQSVKVTDMEDFSEGVLLGLRSLAAHPIPEGFELYRQSLNKYVRDVSLPEVPFLLISDTWRMQPTELEQVLRAAWQAHTSQT